MLDNFYLIAEQIQLSRKHLPRRYSRELPWLSEGPGAGYPRVYQIALELITHVDAQLDAERLSGFIAAYQTVTPLRLGELWALPIMLRLALIENLRRVVVRLAASRRERQTADGWADRLEQMLEADRSRVVIVVGDLAKAEVPLTSAFVAHFCQRLTRMNPAVHIARNWLESHLAEQGLSSEALILTETRKQAADQVSVSHSITSLRFLSSMDWREFVETLSRVDQTLRRDPADVYADMDFLTRDRYRHWIEALARHGRFSEPETAEEAVKLAQAGAEAAGRTSRQAHVGYYLIDKGRPLLERKVSYRAPWPERIRRGIRALPLGFYLGSIAGVVVMTAAAAAAYALRSGVAPFWLGLYLLVVAVASSQLAVALVNAAANWLIPPRRLPRLDFSKGIPPDARTIVVVPTILTDAPAITEMVEALEWRYLANRDPNLSFALLTDFADAPNESMPGDEELLRLVRERLESLNRKYPAEPANTFYLFHRPRLWNPQEGRWMGYERKRGKLAALNAVLRGRGREAFSEIVGDLAQLPHLRFVITLDTDTQLPRDVAHELVGIMAHPLNRPVFDETTRVVREGYAILQPRVGVCLGTDARSRFVRLLAPEPGVDPYTRAVSDVYQDLFGEGSYIGKGIYDIDAFEQAVRGRFPPNAILSHDLIESAHARSGLASDVELFEEHPARYNADVSRRHRWIRGDWQIAGWLLPRVRREDGGVERNPLSALSRWKVFDNLRRSLVPAALVFLLVVAPIGFPALATLSVVLASAVLALPDVVRLLQEALRKERQASLRSHARNRLHTALRRAGQVLLNLSFLPFEAYFSLHAVTVSLVRVLWTRRKLLEWQTAREAQRQARDDLAGFHRLMWVAPALGLAVLAWALATAAAADTWLVPLAFLWLAAPTIAWWISRPPPRRQTPLTAAQHRFLRRLARKTWRFFEKFVNETEHWLPPDNFQEQPTPVIAARTSSTNIGLAMLSNLGAYDLGYLSVPQLIERTRRTLDTLHRLERHRGHFFNWYDTRTLQPLKPRYVSTVDSGNLAVHMLVLAAGLRECAEAELLRPAAFEGLRDTLEMLAETEPRLTPHEALRRPLAAEHPGDRQKFEHLQAFLREMPTAEAFANASPEGQEWRDALAASGAEHRQHVTSAAPWLARGEELSLWPEAVRARLAELSKSLTLRRVATLGPELETALDSFQHESTAGQAEAIGTALRRLQADLRDAIEYAGQVIQRLEDMADELEHLAGDMDFEFLFDQARCLFAIGYNVTERKRDNSFYDLLASEARLASYLAVAQGQVPLDHWWALGRLHSTADHEPVLASWSGSMFEYLMPMLVMPSYDDTLLDRSCKAAVRVQRKYGHRLGVPWGISESGFYAFDAQMNYQYRGFGVPGLGFKRDLARETVIAPYASVLAVMVAPREACENLQRLAAEGCEGAYGLYEAVDYTPTRLPPGKHKAILHSFMAHHEGMSLLSLVWWLELQPMQRRFLALPVLKAAELLLQERVPRAVARIEMAKLGSDQEVMVDRRDPDRGHRIYSNPSTATPEVHLLSNGRYHVMITSAGGGYSRWRDQAVTRWREDPTRDCWGSFCYLRDLDSGEFWSAAHQPVVRRVGRYEAIFTQARAEFRQQLDGMDLHAEISVSPEDDVELRRIHLTNHALVPRTIEFTSYAEVVLAPFGADLAHPAFSNLFVQTESVGPPPALLCTRRARSEDEHPPWLFHLMTVRGPEIGLPTYETERGAFLGRNRTTADPLALRQRAALSNSTGPVLDPIIAMRRTLYLDREATVDVDLITGVAESRETAVTLLGKYSNRPMADRLMDLAATHSQVTLRQLGADESDARLYGRLAGPLVYTSPARRAPSSLLRHNRRSQASLWSHGISGDLPIVLLSIRDAARLELARRLIQAHAYWRAKGLSTELVILNEDASVYRQSLHGEITALVSSSIEAPLLDRPEGIFVRRTDQIPPEDRILLHTTARAVFSDERGTLEEQVRVAENLGTGARPTRRRRRTPDLEPPPAPPPRELLLFNGMGGFTPDGQEYVITLPAEGRVASNGGEARDRARSTPAPWVNVIANPHFGTVVSESGGGYTWFENSHEFRLTPWSNDPVTDPPGEALYLGDVETADVWSAAPAPARGAGAYVVRHGFGYTVFEHTHQGITSELWIYVAVDMPVRFALLRLRNESSRRRRLTVTSYCEWVLGEHRHKTAPHVQTEADAPTGAMLARNPFSIDFSEYIAFADVSETERSLSGDRREFLGRNGTLRDPAGLHRPGLSGRTGPGFDPCAALQVELELPGRGEQELVFTLGADRNLAAAQRHLQRCRHPGVARRALEAVRAHWARLLGAVQCETPDPAVNLLANGWLLYQTLSSRLWGRTGFYQSGGAFGFRDQLQDTLALVHAAPELLREQLLRAAAHQFREGDVQHWWHPPSDRGVRTRFSDDYLWLPYATCRYVAALGDTAVLSERVPYIETRPLRPEEESVFDLPTRSDETGTLYQHCVRAIEHGLRFGEHGLPLIGSGDWNDGYNRIGLHGKGESVWLAFFLYDVLTRFAGIARQQEDAKFAERCLATARSLQEKIEAHAWDGAWYRRAYFDTGEPLGSHLNTECQIDSLPQSWAILSGAGDPARARQALRSVEERLVRLDEGLILLLDPPFDRALPNPGYIKGYVPGIRENGGQYTHAAIWVVMAFARSGQGARAWELFNAINPLRKGGSPERSAAYRVEPYVVAADVYGVPPHIGRGGWTWYTGSAGWMYQLVTETLLGISREAGHLRLAPLLPREWPGFSVRYQYGRSTYQIEVQAAGPETPPGLALDGVSHEGNVIPLKDDGKMHRVRLVVRPVGQAPSPNR